MMLAPFAHADDTSGPVDIGGGRSLYLNCQGEGSPTVFVIPGKGSYVEGWNAAGGPDGPDHSTPVAQPHTLRSDVDDVLRLIQAADLPTPMVFVAHSYGGLVLD